MAVTAEFLVDSIDGLTQSGSISKEFVGLILLPIVGNAAGSQVCSPGTPIVLTDPPHHTEHVTAVTVSVRDKLDLSLGVAVGSSIVSAYHSCIITRLIGDIPHPANCALRDTVSRFLFGATFASVKY